MDKKAAGKIKCLHGEGAWGKPLNHWCIFAIRGVWRREPSCSRATGADWEAMLKGSDHCTLLPRFQGKLLQGQPV